MTRSPGLSDPPSSFRSLFSGTLVTLFVLVAAFVGLNFFQGPKLREVIVDTGSIASASNQRIRLVANQSLAQVRDQQIQISPAAEFRATTSGTILDITLTAPLKFATDYTVTVTDVKSRFNDQDAEFTHKFRTPGSTVAFLDRADPASEPGGNDVIREVAIPDGDPVDLYRAVGIQQFARVGPSLLVVTASEAGGGAIDLVAPDGITTERLLLPVAGEVGELQSSSTVGLVAFTITSEIADPLPRQSTVLYAVDLGGDHVVRAVTGLDGAPLEILDFVVVPGGTLAAAQASDESVSLVDLTGASPAVPVGQFTTLRGVSPEGSQLLVGDIYGAVTLDLADGTQTRLPQVPLDGEQPFIGDIHLTDRAGARVQQIVIFDPDAGSFTSAIAWADNTRARVIYLTPGDSGSIDDFTVSPNGQYVAVASIPDVSTSTTDGAVVDPRSTTITTTIIDVTTGREVRAISGFDLEW